MTSMRQAALVGLREMEIQVVPQPELRGEGDVLVRMAAVGVCGSDVHNYVSGHVGSARVEYPHIVGHEGAGIVEAVGAPVKRVKPGDRVAIEPAMPCGQCDQCRTGPWNTCRSIHFASQPGQAAGLLREWVVMPEWNCIPIPDSMSYEQAAFVEPLTIGVYAVRKSVAMAGAAVGILGAGPVGLSVLLAARAAGAERVYVSEPLEPRRRAAEECGACWVGDPTTVDLTAQVLRREPEALDVVFECAGDPHAVRQGIELIKPGGKLMIIGIPEEDDLVLPVHEMRHRELTLYNVRRQCDCTEETIRLVGDGTIRVDNLVTHRYPLDQCREAFETVAEYRDGVIKAIVEFNGFRQQ